MKISELIKILANTINECGDVEMNVAMQSTEADNIFTYGKIKYPSMLHEDGTVDLICKEFKI